MPFYEYYCQHCKNVHEISKSISDETPETCPKCNQVMDRCIGNPMIKFHGAGWAKDGYSKPKTKENKNE